jgi:NifU-like protein involved in Fe-S cluster formation
MIAFCDVLQHLPDDTSHISSLDFSYCRVSSHGAFVLANALRHNKHVTSVNLCDNAIGKFAARAFVDIMLESNKTIEHLGLHGCGIGFSGARMISELIESIESKQIKSIDLSNNNMSFLGVLIVEQSLSKRLSIGMNNVELDLLANAVLDEVMNSVSHGVRSY